MARKGENIFKRKDGRWEARYIKGYSNNKTIYGYVYDKTYTKVKSKRNKVVSTINLKDHCNTKRSNDDFNNIVNSWLLQKRLVLKQSSYSRYYTIVYKHIIPFFGNMKCEEINEDNVSKFIYLKMKESLSSRTIKDIITIFKQIIKFGKINLEVISPKISKKPIKILDETAQRKLETYIKTNFTNIEMGIFVALYMGLRIGEVCGLKWKDIDLTNKLINVKRTVSRVKNFDVYNTNKTKIIIDEPKTENSKRIIPIPSSIYDLFCILKSNRQDEEYFILTNSYKPMEPRSYYNHYKKILKKLELNGFNFHSLRHTFATRCIELGFDPKTLMEILGHSDIKITLAFYVHPTSELKIKNMEKIKLLVS